MKGQYLKKQIRVKSRPGSIFVFILLFTSSLLFSNKVNGQESNIRNYTPDSLVEKLHSPSKAAIMSACLPGLGQIYNKKYWKLPIVYAGFGILTYFIVTNAQEYSKYKNAYIASVNDDSTSQYQDLINKYSEEDLLSAREYYRRNLEVSCILTGVFYILNIVDAAVDAHLFTFNISKDLSLKLDPVVTGIGRNRNFTSGIRLSLRF